MWSICCGSWHPLQLHVQMLAFLSSSLLKVFVAINRCSMVKHSSSLCFSARCATVVAGCTPYRVPSGRPHKYGHADPSPVTFQACAGPPNPSHTCASHCPGVNCTAAPLNAERAVHNTFRDISCDHSRHASLPQAWRRCKHSVTSVVSVTNSPLDEVNSCMHRIDWQ